MNWPGRRRNAEREAQVARAAAHALTRAAGRGCCCQPRVRIVGWLDTGPMNGPVVALMHRTWCPLPRSMEGGPLAGRMQVVDVREP